MKAAELERVDIPVSGMTCAACARAIERTLSTTDRFPDGIATLPGNVAFPAEFVRTIGFQDAPSGPQMYDVYPQLAPVHA